MLYKNFSSVASSNRFLNIDPEAESYLKHFSWLDDLLFEDVSFQERCKNFWTKKQKRFLDKIYLGHALKKQLRKKDYPPMSLRYVGEKIGVGLYAEKSIAPFTLIGEYTGIVRKKTGAMKNNLYLMQYPTGMWTLHKWVIDAENVGNHTRFINHSFYPNLELRSVLDRNQLKMIFLTSRPLQKNEQLTCDYGSKYWRQLNQAPEMM